MTITIQLDENGLCALQEHREALQKALKKYAGEEVDISIKPISAFSALLDQAVRLQNIHSRVVNGEVKTWTMDEFTLLRSQMSDTYAQLTDFYATAKIDEKTAELSRQMIFERIKLKAIEEDFTPSVSATKAKASVEYEEANKVYLEKYEVRVLIEQHMSALSTTMNAISGVQKNGDFKYLKF